MGSGPSRRAAIVLVGLVAFAGCGESNTQTATTTSSGSALQATVEATTPTSTQQAPTIATVESPAAPALWQRYQTSNSALMEARPPISLAKMASDADMVIRGRLVAVRDGPRPTGRPSSIWTIQQQAIYQLTDRNGSSVELVMRMMPTSSPLQAAVDAAVDPEIVQKAQRDGVDPVGAIDQAAVERAFRDHFDGAVNETTLALRAMLPSEELLVFLFKIPNSDGQYVLYNTASIFVNRAGRAQFALTVPSSAELVGDVAGRPFDDLVVKVAALRDR